MKYTLMPGTTYKFELFAVVGGKEYKDMMRSFTTTGNSDRQNPVITDVSVYDKTETGYKVKCKASDNVGVVKVQFPTWTKANGQDDIQKEWWNNTAASGKKDSDGYYVYEVKISEHNNELGVYYTHIYAYDKAGNSVCYVVPEVAVEKGVVSADKPETKPENTPDVDKKLVVTSEPLPTDNNDDNVSDMKAPGKVELNFVASSMKGCIMVDWYFDDTSDGFQLQYATNKKFKSAKSILTPSTGHGIKFISNLKSKKTYYLRIRAYKFIDGNKKLYGSWSKIRNCKVK